MAPFTIEKLEDILSRGAFDELKDEYENQWFEAKKQPYQIELERQKAEFARDVASLANLDGGYILIGVRTEPESIPHVGDAVKEIHPFESTLVNTDQLEKILRTSIIPIPDGLEVRWISMADDSEKGIVSIYIPKQLETVKPFLHYYVNEKDKKDGVYVGYAKRIGSSTQNQTIKDIQRWIRDGLNYEREIVGRLESIESRIQLIFEARVTESFDDIEKKIDIKKEEHLTKFGGAGERLMLISGFLANPKTPVIFPDRRSIINSLKRLTEGLRNGGWKGLYSAEIEDSSPAVIRTLRKDLKSIELFPDGTAIYDCDLNVLCFIGGELSGKSPTIIPVALVEVIYQFVSYYFGFLKILEFMEEKCFLKIDLLNMHKNGAKTALPSYTAAPMTCYETFEAPENNFSKVIEVEIDSPERTTFIVLNEIYHWFGLFESQIPYKKELETGEYETDLSTFIS